MPVTIVVGGQFGSEGKGKVAHALAIEMGAAAAVRVGGPNSGHTVVAASGQREVFRQLPTACLVPEVVSVIPAGSYIDVDVLLSEIQVAQLSPGRLVVDAYAMLISEADRQSEREQGLDARVGSTLSGTGAAVARRVMRKGDVRFAKDEPRLIQWIGHADDFLRSVVERKGRVVLEGTQGFGLSLLHSRAYPHTTSRDTTAAAVLSEVGLSPLLVDDIVLVIRSYPIRVAGNSGPLADEVDWITVTENSGAKEAIIEHTSVTNRVRRVARFDPAVVRQAIAHNAPTRIVLNHLDYIDLNACVGEDFSEKARAFVGHVEERIGRRIDYVGVSPRDILKTDAVSRSRRAA